MSVVINTRLSRKKISSNTSANYGLPLARSKRLHNLVTLVLRHLTMHGGDGEVVLAHSICEPIHLAACVAEYNCLCNSEGII